MAVHASMVAILILFLGAFQIVQTYPPQFFKGNKKG